MPDLNEATGRFKAWASNGGKKTMARGGAVGTLTLGGLLALVHATPSIFPYVSAAEFNDTTKSVVEVKTEVKNIRSEFTEFKQEYREETRNTQTLIRQLLVAQGIKPVVIDTPPRTDTVFIEVQPADSGKTRPR